MWLRTLNETKGVFGWVVAVKAVVSCELWKKLLWEFSCEKAESCLAVTTVDKLLWDVTCVKRL
jgi:hypothetical protein